MITLISSKKLGVCNNMRYTVLRCAKKGATFLQKVLNRHFWHWIPVLQVIAKRTVIFFCQISKAQDIYCPAKSIYSFLAKFPNFTNLFTAFGCCLFFREPNDNFFLQKFHKNLSPVHLLKKSPVHLLIFFSKFPNFPHLLTSFFPEIRTNFWWI